ncbi:acetylornithine deacetylase [Sphingomonas sp. So64.6b]|nr:acetylornithine deacetylase [Sphingomonas sp. So64.6b]
MNKPALAGCDSIAREAIDILARLVSFDTTSADSNLALIAYVESYLADHGITALRVANADGTKANLLATVGQGTAGGIILSGHTDVVPVVDQPWSSDPFELIERDGRLYGRGTSDMKGFLALAMAAVPLLANEQLERPVHLAFSYDEEVGCLGAPDLIRNILDLGYTPMAAIVGEPTNMQIVNSHKSIQLYEVVVTGREAHSSLVTEGISANMVAIDLLSTLARIAESETHHRDQHFDPPWSTLTVGTIHGGTAPNILARECRFTFDLRCVPDRDAEEVLAPFWAAVEQARQRLAAEGDDTGIMVERLAKVPSLRREPEGAAERLSAMLSGANMPGSAVSYGAEAGQFQQAGLSTVICGPGSITQAHRPDEFIELSQMEAGARFISRLVSFVRVG